jgi:hypothetical protein
MMLFAQGYKNIGDLFCFIIIWVETKYTWIYYLVYCFNLLVTCSVIFVYMSYFGGYVIREFKSTQDNVSKSLKSDRSEELKQLQTMVLHIQTFLMSGIISLWIPASWWIVTRSNFSDNPPGVPKNFYDYISRTLQLWMSHCMGLDLFVRFWSKLGITQSKALEKMPSTYSAAMWFTNLWQRKAKQSKNTNATTDVLPASTEMTT